MVKSTFHSAARVKTTPSIFYCVTVRINILDTNSGTERDQDIFPSSYLSYIIHYTPIPLDRLWATSR